MVCMKVSSYIDPTIPPRIPALLRRMLLVLLLFSPTAAFSFLLYRNAGEDGLKYSQKRLVINLL